MGKNQRQSIALRLRTLREAVEKEAQAVADATGVTLSLYDDYETGVHDVPLSYLSSAAAYFQVEVNALLTGGDSHAHLFQVTRSERGPVVKRRRQYHYEALAVGFVGKAMVPYRVTVEPNELPMQVNTHAGQELNVVLVGTLRVQVDGHDSQLHAGDSIYFDASLPHGMQALDNKPATFLAIITA